MYKQGLRILGGFMAVAGIVILVYAFYSYIAQRQLEETLTAQIPGQNLNGQATTTPVVLSVSNAASSAPGTIPTLDTSRVSPSVTPLPAHATPVQPDEAAVGRVLGTATAISLLPRTPTPASGVNNSFAPATAAATLPTKIASSPLAPGTRRGTGSPATRLVIPKLNMDLRIETADYMSFQQNGQIISDWQVPYTAAGHLSSTAQPGEIGNAVLSGHHNLKGPGEFGLGVFAGIWNLAVGDEIRIVTADGKTQFWQVQETFPVKEAGEPLSVRIQHAQQIMGDTTDPTLTLLTCWNGKSNPLAGNTYRWVIHAKLINIL